MNRTKRATCPSCHRPGRFEDAGDQRWPAVVAEEHGLPQVITLWTCPNCKTTISEFALLEASSTDTVIVPG